MAIKRGAINEIAGPDTAFGINMPENSVVYDRASNIMYELTESASPSSTLNTLTKDQIGGEDIFTKTLTFTVTAPFASLEIIDITTGTGSISGTSTRVVGDTGAVDSLGVDATAFNIDASLVVTDNKTIGLKGVEVIWDSATTFHFTRSLLIGEWFIISDGESSGGLGNITVTGLTNTGTSDLQGNVDIGGTLDVTGDITKSGSTVGSVITYVDDTAGNSIINLPTAVGLLNQSFSYIRTDITANTTTFNPDGIETINSVASFTLGARESITLISDNSNWVIANGNINGLFEIIINSVDDFPVQDATTITLNTGNYSIRNILVTDKQFILPDGAVVEFLGWDPSISGLVYTGVLSAFKGTDFLTFTHDHVFISTPLGTIFDVDNVAPVGAQIFMEDTVYIDCAGIGTIKNIEQFSGYFNAFVDIGQGFDLESVRLINLSQCTYNSWKNEVTTMITFDGDIDTIQLNAIEFIPNTNESVFDFKVSANIASGSIAACPFNKTLGGVLFAAGSRDETDIFLTFGINPGMPRSIAFGNMTIPSVETVAITTIGVPVVVNDANTGGTNIWDELGKTSRFTFSSSLGRYTYIGIENITVISTVSSSIEKSGGGADTLSTLIAKNGTTIPESISTTESATPTSVVSTAEIELVTGDFLELMVQNGTTTVDIDINTSNFIIKD